MKDVGYDPRYMGEDLGENLDQLEAADTPGEAVAAGAGLAWDAAGVATGAWVIDPITETVMGAAGVDGPTPEEAIEQAAASWYSYDPVADPALQAADADGVDTGVETEVDPQWLQA
jgi:hypothetical protein